MTKTTTEIVTNLRLMLEDEVMAIVITTKGRWVKIQRADEEQGVIRNISFDEARAAAARHHEWAVSIGMPDLPAVGDSAISWSESDIEAMDTTTEAEVAEMLEPAAPASMISTLINFQGEKPAEKAPEWDGHTCPKCGSTEIYAGRIKDIGGGMGLVVDDDRVFGCHHCDWEIDYTTQRRNGIVKSHYLDHYTRTNVKRNGEIIRSMDNDDAAARELRPLEMLEEVYELVADKLGIEIEELQRRYSHLNPGQQRMCLGNRLRGFYKKLSAQ